MVLIFIYFSPYITLGSKSLNGVLIFFGKSKTQSSCGICPLKIKIGHKWKICLCVGKLFCPSYFISCNEKNDLEWFEKNDVE